MSLVLILLTVGALGAILVVAAFVNIWVAVLLAWPVYKLADVICKQILYRVRD